MPFDSLKQSLRQWQDNRRAESNARHAAKYGIPAKKILKNRLLEALENGWTKTAAQALEQGASANTNKPYEHENRTYYYPSLIHEIKQGHQDNIALLLKYAPDLSMKDRRTHHTPLIEAVIQNNHALVRTLLDAGVALDPPVSPESPEGYVGQVVTAQDIAANHGYKDIEDMLKTEAQRRIDAAQAATLKKEPPSPAEVIVQTARSIKVSGPIRFKPRVNSKNML